MNSRRSLKDAILTICIVMIVVLAWSNWTLITTLKVQDKHISAINDDRGAFVRAEAYFEYEADKYGKMYAQARLYEQGMNPCLECHAGALSE